MATAHFALSVKEAVMTAVLGQIDAGTGPGYFELYTSPMPANTTVAVAAQIKLGVLTFSDPSGTVVAGELVCAPSPGVVSEDAALADGTAVWARIYDSSANVLLDCDVTVTGGGGAIQLNTVAIKTGGPIIATSFKFTLP